MAWPLCSVLLAAACCVAGNELAAGTGARAALARWGGRRGRAGSGGGRRGRAGGRAAWARRGGGGGAGVGAGAGFLAVCLTPAGRIRLSPERLFAECRIREALGKDLFF